MRRCFKILLVASRASLNELKNFGCEVSVYDPWASAADAKRYYDIDLLQKPDLRKFDCVVIAVAHKQFFELDYAGSLVYDVKNVYKGAQGKL